MMITEDLLSDKRNTLLTLEWVLVIVTSYFVLFSNGAAVKDPRAFFLVAICFLFMLVLYNLPLKAVDHRFFAPFLVIMNTVFISVAIGLNRENPWDLFVVFYFGLFIAAIGENLLQIVVGCLIITVVSIVLNTYHSDSSAMNPEVLIRIPFIFGVSLLYGYLCEQVKKEKQRAENAEKTQNLKRQLVSALAHDIKNPLGAISAYAEMLATGLRENAVSDARLEAVQRIQDNTQRVVKLVTGFLDASRAEGGNTSFTRQPIQINHIIREVGLQQMGTLRKKDISLTMDLEENLPDIWGDEDQIERVLWNLVGNAFKFTPRRGTIGLSSRVEDGHVTISVSDTGLGISEDDLTRLFTEFRRLKGSANIEGTGLGLFIVKTIVEAHGGTVHAESKQGEGSNFVVRFPRDQ